MTQTIVVVSAMVTWLAASPARAADDNAALRYWVAFALLPQMDEARQAKLAEALRPDAAPGDDAAQLVGEADKALLYMARGAALRRCDWGLHLEDGPGLLLPHLAKARDAARLAGLRARLSAERGDGRRAAADAADAMTLARHVGADNILIGHLVQINIEKLTIETLAPRLASLEPAALDDLARRLDALPAGGSLKGAVVVEKTSFYDWATRRLREMKDEDPWQQTVLGGLGEPEVIEKLLAAGNHTRQGVLKQLENHEPYYGKIAAVLDLPPAQAEAKLKELEAGLGEDTVGWAVLPAFSKAYARDAAARTRTAMFKAAVAVARGGPQRLAQFKDPFGGAFEHRPLPDGFELRSKVSENGQPVTLKVGGRR